MKQETFEWICEKFGDPSLPSDERWKSIQYIHIHSSYEPMGSFQEMLKYDRIYYTTSGPEPGFVYLGSRDAAFDMVDSNGAYGLDYTISFLPISAISEITFKGWNCYDEGKDIYGASDIMKVCLSEDVDKYPTYISVENAIVKLENIGDWNPAIKSTRYEDLKLSDLDILYYDMDGNKLDGKPSKRGDYQIVVNCKGKYVGATRGKLVIQ